MELVFNELSVLPHIDNEVVLRQQFLDLLKLFEGIKEEFGFRHIVFPSNIGETLVTTNKNFKQWAYDIPHQGEKNRILSFVKRPFENDILQEQVSELNRYYYHNVEVGIIEKYCTGLAVSYLKDKPCISLASNECWKTPGVLFKEIIDDELNTKDVVALNIASTDDISNDEVQKALLYSGEVELVKCPLSHDKKALNLRHDHGMSELKAFSKRLFQSNYVVSVINSLPFNPKDVNLVKRIHADGKIELVLYWESAGYGLIIQTTGRNLRETEEIAKIIKEKFDR